MKAITFAILVVGFLIPNPKYDENMQGGAGSLAVLFLIATIICLILGK
jgi:hypothetical protein